MDDLMKSGEIDVVADFVNNGGRDTLRMPVAQLPVIDLTPFTHGGSADERAHVAAQLREACIHIGFFYLTGHGFPPSELEEEIAWGHRFFGQPMQEKMKVHKKKGGRLGFLGVGGVNPAQNDDKSADIKETFTMTREPMPGEPGGYRMSIGESQWPGGPGLAGFEPFMKRQIAKRIVLAQHLARAFALSLGLPEERFDESHRFLGCNFTYNYYPAMSPEQVRRTQWGISPHTDYGSFTILSQDSLGGLEVRNAAGNWIAVPPVSGMFVVNIGDLFARWTNDFYTSNFHRAANFNPEGRARISLPFFVYPHASVTIDCLESCHGPGNPPRYKPVNAVEYVQSLVLRSNETGRPGVARETVSRLKQESGMSTKEE
jgi:isopenicillin N synthase-like dioxygenase